MSGVVEELDEWDADFLNQYIQVEERALTSQHHQSQPPPPPPPPFLFSQPLQQQQPPWPPSSSQSVTHSPPRELTQRTTNPIIAPPHSPPPPPSALPSSADDKQLEIDRLKEELGHVRQKLSHLEQECSQLREKYQQRKNLTSRNEKKDAVFPNPESAHFNRGGRESGDIVLAQNEDPRRFQNAICSHHQPGSRIGIGASMSKSAGVQTDQTIAPVQAMPNSDLRAYDGLSKKLLAIWESPNEQELGRNLISNLLMACQTDFHFLFGSVGTRMSSKLRMDKVGDDSSSVALQYHFDMSHTPEASKVSYIFSVLTKVKNGMLGLEALFQPLVNLCSHKNVIIVKASLHILHVFLKHLLSLERPFERRFYISIGGALRDQTYALLYLWIKFFVFSSDGRFFLKLADHTELKLSRNAILVLAFLASSGKSGFEILVSHELCQDASFLMLILQVLASDVDTEVAVHADQAQVFKERTLLIREALILLNRLVSNPAYSGTVLHLLTSSRDMASLTIEVANRFSQKDQISEKFSGIARRMWESEIVDLARVFKKRVFTYLGDNISECQFDFDFVNLYVTVDMQTITISRAVQILVAAIGPVIH